MQRKALSLAWETAQLAHAVEAARLLVAHQGSFAEESDEQASPMAAAALLGMLVARLELLSFALGGLVNPLQLVTPHNSTSTAPVHPDDQDLRLEEWSPQRRKGEAQAELSRLTRRARRAKRSGG